MRIAAAALALACITGAALPDAALAQQGTGAASQQGGTAQKKPAEPAVPAPAVTRFADVAVSVRGVTDYNFRGVSQTNLSPGVQGAFELTLFEGLVYGGLAGYSVDLPTRPLAELDLTVGIRPKFGPLTFDFGLLRFEYPGERRLIDPVNGLFFTPANTDYNEIVAKVTLAATDQITLGFNSFNGFNYLGTGTDNTYLSGTFKYVVPNTVVAADFGTFAVSGEFGYQTFHGVTTAGLGSIALPEYFYGNIGVAYTYKNTTIDVRYHDTDLTRTDCFVLTSDPKGIRAVTGGGRGTSNWCGAAFIATLSVDFTAASLFQ